MAVQVSQRGAASERSAKLATTWAVWVLTGIGGTLRSEAGPAALMASRYAARPATVGRS
jgi:hypothetical protein